MICEQCKQVRINYYVGSDTAGRPIYIQTCRCTSSAQEYITEANEYKTHFKEVFS
jgi:hypothetical protein